MSVKVGNYPKKPKLHLCKPTTNQPGLDFQMAIAAQWSLYFSASLF